MNLDSFADDRPHAHPRVERCVGILKDDLHLAAQMAQFGSRKRRQVAAIEEDLAGGRLEQFEHQTAQGRFAGA